jgi:hypothetical protein
MTRMRLAGILSTLVLRAKKGYEGEYDNLPPTEKYELEEAFRFAGVSARYCRESLVFFRLSACCAAGYLKTVAISLCPSRCIDFLGLPRPRARSGRLEPIETPAANPCQPSNHKDGGCVKR